MSNKKKKKSTLSSAVKMSVYTSSAVADVPISVILKMMVTTVTNIART